MRKHAAFPTGAPPPGYRLTVVNGLSFVVEARYTPLKTLGCGAYGVVCAAAVAGEEEHVAIKKMGGIFDETKGSLGEAKRALRELLLLRHLQHDNLLTLRHVMLPPPDCGDVYIVSDLLDSDLSRVIASPEALSEDHVRYFLYQLLCGVQFLHSANVVHRDLKPSNILVNRECDLRIADFGLARSLDEPSDLMPGVYGESGSVDSSSSSSSSGGEGARAPGLEPNALMTQYVVTRWYRAPELLLLYDKYSHAVDLWSVGCILAELLGRKPLFPGHNFKHQLQLIIDLVGSPPADSLGKVDARIQGFVRMWSGRPAQPLATALPAASAEVLSLLERLLQFQPQDRLAADGALRHSYLDQFADEEVDEVDEVGSLPAEPPTTAPPTVNMPPTRRRRSRRSPPSTGGVIALALANETLARRRYRSCLDSAPSENCRSAYLSEMHGDRDEGPHYSVTQLQVMTRDGTMRFARSLFEWFQQLFVEQCAVVVAFKDNSVVDKYGRGVPFQLDGDGIKPPVNCMGCAGWWTEYPGPRWKGRPRTLFDKLVKTRRQAELEVRVARIVLPKAAGAGPLLFELVEPFLRPPPVASFPCAPAELGSFLQDHFHEMGGNIWWHPPRERLVAGTSTQSPGYFTEGDHEDGAYSYYAISETPQSLQELAGIGDWVER